MLEANLKAEKADYEKIRKEREEKAYPILQQMENWMKQTANICTPKSPLGKAISACCTTAIFKNQELDVLS